MNPIRNSPPHRPEGRASASAISNGINLLIVTQAVDTNDLLLGFFHRWIEKFAEHCERMHVVCLKEGAHHVPQNVSIHSLGKERGRSRIKYILRFFAYVWKYRREYDAVFVHMNQEYVLLAGILWRVLGKRIVLWRNHQTGSWQTRIAGWLAHTVCYTSPSAYVSSFNNAIKMPLGIDTDMFKPEVAEQNTVLFLGRVDPVKRVHVCISALEMLTTEGVVYKANIYGEPSEGNESYAKQAQEQARPLVESGAAAFHGGIGHAQTPAVYVAHEIYVNITPSGSFDKTIGEAMASGCIVVTANNAVRDIMPAELFVADNSVGAVARAIRTALALDSAERIRISNLLREYVCAEHSLDKLAQRLMAVWRV